MSEEREPKTLFEHLGLSMKKKEGNTLFSQISEKGNRIFKLLLIGILTGLVIDITLGTDKFIIVVPVLLLIVVLLKSYNKKE